MEESAGLDWAQGMDAAAPGHGPNPRTSMAADSGSACRVPAVIFGAIGALGALYLGLTLPSVIHDRQARISRDAQAHGWQQAVSRDRDAAPRGDDRRHQFRNSAEWGMSEVNRASRAAQAQYEGQHLPQLDWLWPATYALFAAALLGAGACLLVAVRRGLAAGLAFLFVFTVPALMGQDWILLAYPVGFLIAGVLAFFVTPVARRVSTAGTAA